MPRTYTEIWSDLPSDAREAFAASAKILDLKRGDRVYQQGDPPRGLYFVEKGLVGLVLIGATSGKEHLVRFFKAGQFFGHRSLFSHEGYHGTTTALEPTRLRLVPSATVHAVLEKHPKLYEPLVQVLAKELRRSEIQRVMILENEMLARTAQSIVYLKDLHPDHPWTRQEIANFCASTVSTVIKAMGELEDRGLIRQDGRSFSILDRDGLIALQEH